MRTLLTSAVVLLSMPVVAQAAGSPTALSSSTSIGPTRDFDLHAIPEFTAPSPLQDGMIAQQEVGPDAHLGVGLAPMMGRNIHSLMIERDLIPTDNPGVSFVVKFPG